MLKTTKIRRQGSSSSIKKLDAALSTYIIEICGLAVCSTALYLQAVVIKFGQESAYLLLFLSCV